MHALFRMQELPRARCSWLIHELTDEAIQIARNASIDQLCPRANVLTADSVQRAVAAGFSVRAWGIKTPELLLHAVNCGAQGATVNWPDVAVKTLASEAQTMLLNG